MEKNLRCAWCGRLSKHLVFWEGFDFHQTCVMEIKGARKMMKCEDDISYIVTRRKLSAYFINWWSKTPKERAELLQSYENYVSSCGSRV